MRIAPEILLGIRSGNLVEYDHSVDWYSLGVVACRMLTNQVRIIVDWFTHSRSSQNISIKTKPSLYRLELKCVESVSSGRTRANHHNDEAKISSMNLNIRFVITFTKSQPNYGSFRMVFPSQNSCKCKMEHFRIRSRSWFAFIWNINHFLINCLMKWKKNDNVSENNAIIASITCRMKWNKCDITNKHANYKLNSFQLNVELLLCFDLASFLTLSIWHLRFLFGTVHQFGLFVTIDELCSQC